MDGDTVIASDITDDGIRGRRMTAFGHFGEQVADTFDQNSFGRGNFYGRDVSPAVLRVPQL